MKIPPPPKVTVFAPFDRTPSESRREKVSIGHEDTMHAERADKFFFANLAKTDRYGR